MLVIAIGMSRLREVAVQNTALRTGNIVTSIQPDKMLVRRLNKLGLIFEGILTTRPITGSQSNNPIICKMQCIAIENFGTALKWL